MNKAFSTADERGVSRQKRSDDSLVRTCEMIWDFTLSHDIEISRSLLQTSGRPLVPRSVATYRMSLRLALKVIQEAGAPWIASHSPQFPENNVNFSDLRPSLIKQQAISSWFFLSHQQ